MPLRSLCNLSYDLMNVSLKSGFRSLPITKETNRCHLIVCTVSKNAIKHLFFIGSWTSSITSWIFFIRKGIWYEIPYWHLKLWGYKELEVICIIKHKLLESSQRGAWNQITIICNRKPFFFLFSTFLFSFCIEEEGCHQLWKLPKKVLSTR